MLRIGRNKRVLLGSIVVGAAVVLTSRAIKRRRARRGMRRVARFGVLAMAHRQDAGWEGLPGRSLFKRLCAKLAELGYPPSDVGDIEAAHACKVFVGAKPLFLTMAATAEHEWEVVVSRALSAQQKPGSAPKNTAPVRAFLNSLDRALNSLEETEEIRWV